MKKSINHLGVDTRATSKWSFMNITETPAPVSTLLANPSRFIVDSKLFMLFTSIVSGEYTKVSLL
jgi:hypothetical protein